MVIGLGQRVGSRGYDKGALIFGEGEPGQGLYVVVSGGVRVFKSSADGKEQVLHHIGPGQSFNDVAAFDGGPSPASAQAVEPTVVVFLPRDTLRDLMRRYPEFALAVVDAMCRRLRQVSGLVEHLALHHVVARVAGALRDLSRGGTVVALPTRQELAAMVGTVREVATRALRDLERRGLIRLGPGRRATIVDRSGLERASGGIPPAARQSPPR